jgi:hypothetical protein
MEIDEPIPPGDLEGDLCGVPIEYRKTAKLMAAISEGAEFFHTAGDVIVFENATVDTVDGTLTGPSMLQTATGWSSNAMRYARQVNTKDMSDNKAMEVIYTLYGLILTGIVLIMAVIVLTWKLGSVVSAIVSAIWRMVVKALLVLVGVIVTVAVARGLINDYRTKKMLENISGKLAEAERKTKEYNLPIKRQDIVTLRQKLMETG